MLLSMKAILISAGVVLAAMGMKLLLPIAVDEIPTSAIVAWLKPPYLYVVVNCIILTIVVTSRFHKSQSESESELEPEQLISIKSHLQLQPSFETFSADDHREVELESDAAAVEFEAPILDDSMLEEVETEKEIVVEAESEISSIIPVESRSESLVPARPKRPPVASRSAHRKSSRTRNNPEGSKLRRVSRPKRQETLETTWKMITEGRHVPLTRHHKRSEPSDLPIESESTTRIIRREPSPGQEELNRRVEAFIKKFNEEMRIQRQESLKQFKEMINHGV